jgi:hypothetical protein
MRIENFASFQQVTSQEGIGNESPGKGRSQRDGMKVNLAIREHPKNFPLCHPLDIRISGIIHSKVIPKKSTISLHHA